MKVDMVTEWILWHWEGGADHFVLNVCRGAPELYARLEFLKSTGISIDIKRSDNDIWGNNELILKSTRETFAENLREHQGLSTWMAFIDVDEMITPHGTTPQGESFAALLSNLNQTIDYVYLRWLWYPVPLYTLSTPYFSSPAVYTFNFRFSDEKVITGDFRNTGKSVVKPDLMEGTNGVHWFDPISWQQYDAKLRRYVPSAKLENGEFMPPNCSSWETKYGKSCPTCCYRGPDTFGLGHYRRRAPARQVGMGTGAKGFGNENTTYTWAPDSQFGKDEANLDKCALVASVCYQLAKLGLALKDGGGGEPPLPLSTCEFPVRGSL